MKIQTLEEWLLEHQGSVWTLEDTAKVLSHVQAVESTITRMIEMIREERSAC